MVFYRKYRPQRIFELDKEEIRNSLFSIFKVQRVPHAFLFAGPKGTGKTSAARIVAKIINCEKRKKGESEPCNKCQNCQSITKGTHLDVFEIDAASNRGIDEIRSLREKVGLAPGMGMYKVYIIDEVHMLTREAFNALLKTLEEPPSHVVFILATTETEKLPETIVSRCLKMDFFKATSFEILRSLKRVVKGEKINVSDEALGIIADFAGGSFRDATKYLEQAFVEDKLTSEKINLMLGVGTSPEKFLLLVFEKKTKEAIEYLNNLVEQGANLRLFLEAVINHLHDMLLQEFGVNEKSFNSKDKIQINDLKKLINLFSKAHMEMKTSFIEELPVEMAVIEWGERPA